MLFCRKTDQTRKNLKESPPFNEPAISEQFFHDPTLCPNFKNQKPPPNFRGGEETMTSSRKRLFLTSNDYPSVH